MEGIQLRTRNPADRVALRGVRVHAALVGLAQRTRVEQTFVNLERVAVEAVYTFPLPDGAAVCGFEVVTGDRVLTGVIEENDAAVEQYESAIADGDAAYMAEQDRPDVFTVRVGNLKPRQAATIRLTYVRPLEVVDGNIRLAFPTTLAPRYTTGSGVDPLDAAVDGEALNPPHVLDVPYGLTLTADVRLGRKVAAITSPTHAVSVEVDGDGHRVTLVDAAMDRELVLSIDLAADIGTHVQVERGNDNESYLAVTFAPEFAEVAAGAAPVQTEVVFVLDCSGSMAGESIAQATAALELCLRTLNLGDTFNVCRFGSSFELMAPEPLPYTEASLNRAVAYVRSTGADLGGTEILAPLEAVLRPPAAGGRLRTVILLTDGQVTNEPAVLALARRHRGRNRIFPFGIGPAVSTFLVNGLARATGGAAEFVAPGERIEAKVLRTFARVSSPVATDVTIDWGDADVQTLAELPPVFDGDVLGVFARCAGKLPERVTLSCRTASGVQQWSADLPRNAVEGTTVATVWARRAIQSLEEVNGVGRSARLTPGSREAAEVVRLSKGFGLLSSLTTYIAVEHRTPAERNAGTPATRRVPVMLASGWGGASGGAVPAPMVAAAPAGAQFGRRAPSPLRPAVSLGSVLRKRSAAPAAEAGIDRLRDSIDRTFDPAVDAPKKAAPAQPVPACMPVLLRQEAAGGFAWDEMLETLAHTRVADWDSQWTHGGAQLGVDPAADIAETVKALVLLQVGFAAEQAVWTRSAGKAARYVAATLGRPLAEVVAWMASL